MKNLTLPALLLTFIASSNTSYGSLEIEEKPRQSHSTKLSLPLDEAQNHHKAPTQSKNFEVGLRLLAEKKTSLAKQYFLKALDEGYVLGHLYSGALETEDYQTRYRYLYIASKGVDGDQKLREQYNQHKIELTKEGFLSPLEWRIKKA